MISEQPPQKTNMTELLEASQYETYEANDPSLIEKSLDKLNNEIDGFRHDDELHAFVQEVARTQGTEIADTNDLDEEEFKSILHSMLDTRKGKGRDEATDVEYSPEALELLEKLKQKYMMVGDTVPEEPDFDMGFAHGGAADTSWRRLGYLLQLINQGKVQTDTIGMLASERPVNDAERTRAEKSGYSKSGVPAMTEFDLARNAASDRMDITDDEWTLIEGNDPTIPEQHRYQHTYKIAYAEKDGKHVFVLSAPMIVDNRLHPDGKRRNRSNTADTMAMVAKMLTDVRHEPKVVASTDSVFQFQRPDGESRLAPLGVEYHQIGYSRETAGMPDHAPRYYAQELWSLINQTYKARDYLRNQLNHTA